MPLTAADVERALLTLPTSDRARIVQQGLHSLEPIDDATGQDRLWTDAWHDELRRRIAEVEQKASDLVDVSDSHARIRQDLARARSEQ